MIHDHILRTTSGSLASCEGDLADNDIEEADTGEYSPYFRHRRQGRRAAPTSGTSSPHDGRSSGRSTTALSAPCRNGRRRQRGATTPWNGRCGCRL
uniref:Uncharacterized protein n=1 Tax=Leersia perrieri TaxID=77586 RepID=A0A0D9WYD5_9ORYZ